MRLFCRNRLRHFVLSSLAVALVFVLGSCSFAQPEGAAAGRPADYPDTSMKNATYVLGQPERRPLKISGETIDIYQKAKVAYLHNITFEQQNDDGSMVLRGSADDAKIDMDTHDVEISGHVLLDKVDEGMTIRCESLVWIDSLQRIETVGDDLVTVSYGDGNSLTGRGFTGQLDEALYEFAEIEKGYVLP
ncbi:MAG: LPS export ABC transporter periplasmic protein LptC [Sphaerochaetaceae bacterium]|jgi:LPS export ABC transporter protein LptC